MRAIEVGLALAALIATACGSHLDQSGLAGPSASAGVSPTATPASPAPTPNTAVELHEISGGGDRAWISRSIDGALGTLGFTEVWAVPLAGRDEPQLVLRYPRSYVGETFVSRQLSPDGARFAFSADGGGRQRIFVAEVRGTSWRTVDLGTDDLDDGHPTWSPDGLHLAFSRMSRAADGRIAQGGLWVIDADGRNLRKLRDGTTAPTYVYDWTPDGKYIGIAQNVGYDLIDASSGQLHLHASVVAPGSWRRPAPSFVGVMSGPGSELTLATGSGPDALTTTILRVAAPQFVSAPRWSPTRDEFLYLRSGPGGNGTTTSVRIYAAGQQLTVTMFGNAASAEWAPDGDHLVYLRADVVPDPAHPGGESLRQASLRLIGRDGTGEREIFASEANGIVANIAGDFTTRHY